MISGRETLMGGTLAKLDKSGWSSEALERGARFEAEKQAHKALQAARAAHPLARALDGVSEASTAASEAPRYLVKSVDFGNGHRECVVWREEPNLQRTLERAIERDVNPRAARGESEDREASIKASTRRAKQKVRHVCKAMAVNSLWTLTYRENVRDRDLCLRHLDEFRRRVVAQLGDWRYLAVLEKQDRGAYHFHLATHALPVYLKVGGVKLKSWNVMRAIWRRVVGDLGGNFDEAKRRGRFSGTAKPFRSAGAIASYLAGYVAKDLEAVELNKRRFMHSKGVEVPPAYRALFDGATPLRELLELAYAAVGDRVTRTWFDADRGVFFVESDDSVPVG